MIGQGANGVVKNAKHIDTGNDFAVKIIKTYDDELIQIVKPSIKCSLNKK